MISAYISGVYLRWYVMVCVCFHGVVSVLSLCGMCGDVMCVCVWCVSMSCDVCCGASVR